MKNNREVSREYKITLIHQLRHTVTLGRDIFGKRFYRGELEKKDTFSRRILTEEPKFVQKRKDTEK